MSEEFESNVRKMMRGQYALVPQAPALAIEGFTFAPVNGVPYAREGLTFVFESPISNGLISHRMVWNLSFIYSNGKGTRAAGLVRGRVLEFFRPGLKLEANGDTVVVMESSRSGAIEEADRVTLPLAIVIQAWTAG